MGKIQKKLKHIHMRVILHYIYDLLCYFTHIIHRWLVRMLIQLLAEFF